MLKESNENVEVQAETTPEQTEILNTLTLPAADDEEAWEEVYNRLGRPEKPDGYQFDPLPELVAMSPESVEIDQEYAAMAHKAGLTARQARLIRDWFVQKNEQQVRNMVLDRESASERSREALLKQLGSEEKLKEHLGYAKKVLRRFGDESVIEHLEATGLGNDIVLANFLAKVGRAMGEDTLKDGETKPFMSQEYARNEIAAITSNKNHPYWDRRAAGHKEAIERMARLFEIAYPDTT